MITSYHIILACRKQFAGQSILPSHQGARREPEPVLLGYPQPKQLGYRGSGEWEVSLPDQPSLGYRDARQTLHEDAARQRAERERDHRIVRAAVGTTQHNEHVDQAMYNFENKMDSACN